MRCTLREWDEFPKERDYENHIAELWQVLDLVQQMRAAQKDANDMIARVECYQEAQEYIRKAEEVEREVDEWFDTMKGGC